MLLMRQPSTSRNAIQREWGCPHCGPTPDESRYRCNRCGQRLKLVTNVLANGPLVEKGAAQPTSTVARGARLRLGVAASVLLVLAMAGLLRPPGGAAAVPPLGVAAAAGEGAGPVLAARPGAIAEPREAAPLAAPDGVHRPGDLGQALEHYRAALAERPADAELLDNVGQVLVAMNRPADAVPFLKQAVGAEPSNMTARFDLAVAHARSGQLKEAVEDYTALTRSNTADVRVHHNLGLALRQLGRQAEAAAAFERATSLAPEEAPAWLGLALSLEADGRGGEAAAALDRYLTLEPHTADADNVRARIARLRPAVEPSSPSPDPGSATNRRSP